MVDRFDPNGLRLDLLRRIAQSQAAPAQSPSWTTRCWEELQLWFRETPWARRGDTGAAGSEPEGTQETRCQEGDKPRRSFPWRALRQHAQEGFRQIQQDFKVLLFLSFPADSPFSDPTVEGLFQWHYTRRSWVCWDWSSLAVVLMLCWDIAMNPPYRVILVLFFYAAFGVGLLMRKVLTFASPSAPMTWRLWHNAILCTFFFGRCVICQPLLVSLAAEGSHLQAVQVEAFSSVIGLGMTNLSMVFMQQMQTVDTLLFCFANGAVFILWIIFVLQMPLTDALHTAYVGSIVITAVCVRQQRDLEELERKSFDQQLLNTRGLLLRGAEQVRRQASEVEFGFHMAILERSRRVEHLTF